MHAGPRTAFGSSLAKILICNREKLINVIILSITRSRFTVFFIKVVFALFRSELQQSDGSNFSFAGYSSPDCLDSLDDLKGSATRRDQYEPMSESHRQAERRALNAFPLFAAGE